MESVFLVKLFNAASRYCWVSQNLFPNLFSSRWIPGKTIRMFTNSRAEGNSKFLGTVNSFYVTLAIFKHYVTLAIFKHMAFCEFSPEHLKVSKMELWWDLLIQSRKRMRLKFTEKLCVMTTKNDERFEQEPTWCFKTDMRNFTNFDPSTQKSKKFAFSWAPCDQSI